MRLLPVLMTALLTLTSLAGRARAQEPQDAVQIYYSFTPAPGKGSAVQDALRQHVATLRAQSDPWTQSPRGWATYRVIAGENIGDFIIVAYGLRWADLDTYDAQVGSRGELYYFSDDILPTLSSHASMIQVRNEDVLRLPESDRRTTFLSVTLYRIKPGSVDAFWDVMGQIHEAIGNANHQLRYLFYTAVAGAPEPQVIGVTFHDAWTNRADLNPADLESLLQGAYGGPATAAMADRFWGTIEATENMILLPVR